MSSITAYERFMATLERLARYYWWLDDLRRDIAQGRFVVRVPRVAEAAFSLPGLANLSYFWCRNRRCGWVGTRGRCVQRGRTLICPECGQPVTQAYVGAPMTEGATLLYYRIDSAGPYRLQPVTRAIGSYCRFLGTYKHLVVADEERPVASLTFACPDPTARCRNKSPEGFCLDSSGRPIRLRFPSYRGERYRPSHLSEALTKSLTISAYDIKESIPLNYDREVLVGVEDVRLGSVTVYEVCIAYLLGHPYARRRERIPVVTVIDGRPTMLGRKLKTEGLLFRLERNAVERAHRDLIERGFSEARADAFTITHTFAHTILNALPILSGLSPSEFGEAVWVREDTSDYEVLIYDNSKGGIGGIRSVTYEGREILPDLYSYLPNSADCKRGCEVACRACTFFERCGMLNYALNRHAIPYIVNLDYCRRLWAREVLGRET